MPKSQPSILDVPETPASSAVVVRADGGLPAPAPGGESAGVPSDFVAMIERVACNPDVPVDKLERLLSLQERILDRNAKAEFESAFAAMQGELPEITERGAIVVNGQTRSTYAKFEDIIAAVRPVLTKHGFALRHKNEQTEKELIIRAILSHRGGHSEFDEFRAEPDNSGAKGDIQQIGSTRSYGQRYTTISILGIVTRGADDDGHTANRKGAVEPPGYQAWLERMRDIAGTGMPALETEWQKTAPTIKTFAATHDKNKWNAIKQVAEQLSKVVK